MILFPAIDLKEGRCVRLLRGEADSATLYDDDPVARARQFVDAGARYLHVVDLDGAFGEDGPNPAALSAIISAVDVPVQTGGGIRSLEAVRQRLEWGAVRVILGTVAVEQPDIVAQAVDEFGADRIVVGLDVHRGQVAVKGWTEQSAKTALHMALEMKAMGINTVLNTHVERDGTLEGPAVAATGELARESGLEVIASGGVSSLDDLERLKPLERDGVTGVVVGKALYEGRFGIEEALNVLDPDHAG